MSQHSHSSHSSSSTEIPSNATPPSYKPPLPPTRKMPPGPKYLNLLLVGPSGTGKTTWINAIDNYFEFASLHKRAQLKANFLTPLQFTMTDADYNEVLIQCPPQSQGTSNLGSRTLHPEIYTIDYDQTRTLRLIDTRGFSSLGDVSENVILFDTVLNYLADKEDELEEIDAILFFLGPNENRLDDKTQFFLKQLLTCLPRSASDHIFFCFTNTRGNSYRPGESLRTLREFFKNVTNPPMEIPLSLTKFNMFCFDNECIRFLAARSQNVDVGRDQFTSSHLSWEVSASEGRRLVEQISTKSHGGIPLPNIFVLSDMTSLLQTLSAPIFDLCQVIRENISRAYSTDFDDLHPKFQLMTVEFGILRKPQIVCLSTNCRKMSNRAKKLPLDPGSRLPLYSSFCEENLRILSLNKAPAQPVTRGIGENCRTCKCDESSHIAINLAPFLLHQTFAFESVQDLVVQLEREFDDVLRIPRVIQNFIKENAIGLFDDIMMDHVGRRRRHMLAKDDMDIAEVIEARYERAEAYKKKIYSTSDLFSTMRRRCVHYALMGSSVMSMMTQVQKLMESAVIEEPSKEPPVATERPISLETEKVMNRPENAVPIAQKRPLEVSSKSNPQQENRIEHPNQTKTKSEKVVQKVDDNTTIVNDSTQPKGTSTEPVKLRNNGNVQFDSALKAKRELANTWSFAPPNSRERPHGVSFRRPSPPSSRDDGWVTYHNYYPPEPRRRRQLAAECNVM